MKKIMFNDKYGLTKAVLNGKKTQTRRVINLTDTDKEYLDTAFDWDLRESVIIDRYAKYKVGEVVAVAMSYKDVGINGEDYLQKWTNGNDGYLKVSKSAGWNNKMFVKAELMPYHIRITNIRVERLQDISDEDVLKEGFEYVVINNGWGNASSHWEYAITYFTDLGLERNIRSPYAQEAFGFLIGRISNYHTWDSNPYVFVYDFELIN